MPPLQSGGRSHGSVRHQRTSTEALRAPGAWSSSLLASGPSPSREIAAHNHRNAQKAEGADLSRPAEAPDPGRDHPGTVGDIISERVGGIIPERRAGFTWNRQIGLVPPVPQQLEGSQPAVLAP